MCAAFDPLASLIAVGLESGTVAVLDAQSRATVRRMPLHVRPVVAVRCEAAGGGRIALTRPQRAQLGERKGAVSVECVYGRAGCAMGRREGGTRGLNRAGGARARPGGAPAQQVRRVWSADRGQPRIRISACVLHCSDALTRARTTAGPSRSRSPPPRTRYCSSVASPLQSPRPESGYAGPRYVSCPLC